MSTPESNLRDPLALAMLSAWLNCPADKLPATMNAHTCEVTMTAWKRVGEMALAYWQEHESARHRQAGIAEGLELAAKVADRRDTGDLTREDMEARRIAAAIRALSDEGAA